MGSVVGTILDPAADKALMTTLTVTLAVKGLLPGMISVRILVYIIQTEFTSPVPLAIIILGRDILLSLAAFVIRYRTLPPPVRRSIPRYLD